MYIPHSTVDVDIGLTSTTAAEFHAVLRAADTYLRSFIPGKSGVCRLCVAPYQTTQVHNLAGRAALASQGDSVGVMHFDNANATQWNLFHDWSVSHADGFFISVGGGALFEPFDPTHPDESRWFGLSTTSRDGAWNVVQGVGAQHIHSSNLMSRITPKYTLGNEFRFATTVARRALWRMFPALLADDTANDTALLMAIGAHLCRIQPLGHVLWEIGCNDANGRVTGESLQSHDDAPHAPPPESRFAMHQIADDETFGLQARFTSQHTRANITLQRTPATACEDALELAIQFYGPHTNTMVQITDAFDDWRHAFPL